MAKDKKVPPILYKYRFWDDNFQHRILTENEVYLSSASQFNDPFDASLPFRYREEQLTDENIFLKLYQLAKHEHAEWNDAELHEICFARQSDPEFDPKNLWKEHFEGFKENVHATHGIFSMTSKSDNLLMWSHYSNSHKGFCIGLDSKLLFESVGGGLFPVFYETEFPRMDILPDLSLPGAGMLSLVTTKSVDWEYEDEFRLVKIGAVGSTFNFPNDAVKEVVLGWMMEEGRKQEIVDIVKAKFPQANVFQSWVSNEEFKLIMIPVLKN